MKDIELNLDKKNKLLLIADSLSALNRLKILELIKKGGGEYSHKKIAEILGIKSSSVTFHISSLISAGLISEDVGRGLLGRKNKIPKLLIKKITIEL